MRENIVGRASVHVSVLCASLLAAASSAHAQHTGAATAVFDFLNISYDAQSVAFSGASVALPSDLYGLFSNPAALSFVSAPQTCIGYRPLPAGVFGVPLAYALPHGGKGVFGFGISGMTSGKIDATDEGPDGGMILTGGQARADFFTGNAAWAVRVNDYCGAGVTVKGIYNSLNNGTERWSADGFAFDAGLQYRFLNSRLIYGFAARNIGLMRSGFEKSDDYALPSVFEIGVSYVPDDIRNLRATIDINKKRDDYLTFEPGAEVELIKKQMVIRGGYNVSWRDLESFKKMLAGDAEVNYVKSNRISWCAGAGFISEIADHKVNLDAALEFSTVPVLPAFVVSMLVSL